MRIYFKHQNSIIKNTANHFHQLLLLLLMCLPLIGWGQQVNIQKATPSFFGTPINATSGESVYRVHIYVNNGDPYTDGSLEFTHTNVPSGLDLDFLSVKVVMGGANPYVTAVGPYNYDQNPMASGSLLDGFTVLGSLASGGSGTGGYFSSTSTLSSVITTTSSIGSGEFIFIIEEFKVVDCPAGTPSYNVDLKVDFSSGTPNMCAAGSMFCTTVPNEGTINIVTPESVKITGSYIANNEQFHELVHETVPGTCESTVVNRVLEFELTEQALTDLQVTIHLNKIRNDKHQLFDPRIHVFL